MSCSLDIKGLFWQNGWVENGFVVVIVVRVERYRENVNVHGEPCDDVISNVRWSEASHFLKNSMNRS